MKGAVATIDAALASDTMATGKYLTFFLGDEEYGIGITRVKEIIGKMPITPVPRTPLFIKGVINLRGKVIPVIDLRCRFDMEEVGYTDRTCILVVEIDTASLSILTGIVVDSVSEVLSIKKSEIEPPPAFGETRLNSDYILGLAKLEDGVKILLNVDQVLAGQEITGIEQAAKMTTD